MRQQTIALISFDPGVCCHMTSLGHSVKLDSINRGIISSKIMIMSNKIWLW